MTLSVESEKIVPSSSQSPASLVSCNIIQVVGGESEVSCMEV